jgi:para-aminobenzoate synthetase component I
MSRPPGRAGDVVERELEAVPRRDGIVDLDALVAALGPCDVLESADRSGWSYVMPHDLSRGLLIDDGRRTRLEHADGSVEDLGPDPLAALDTVTTRLGLDPTAPVDPALSMPLRGGLVGAFAYELADRIHPHLQRRRRDAGQPDLLLRIVGALVAVSRERDRAVVVVDRGIQGTDLDTVQRDLEGRCRAVGREHPPRAEVRDAADPSLRATTSLPHAAHTAAIRAVQDLIARGGAYQVNLAQRLAVPFIDDLTTLHRRLRAASPASHAALLPAAGLTSVSPERFLEVNSGTVITDPIKGTRPRADDPLLDAALADDLITSAKDRAENVMVVDLERNDLGQVCVPGSIEVPTLLELRALPTVWHLVSSVRGRLRPDTTYADLLRAAFPSGSVTGAPRLAAMQSIRALEPVPRGWYCGAIGWLGRGSASLSVAIRTATLRDGVATYGAGGGVVTDSIPDDEVAESLDKAVAFLRAIGVARVGSTLERPSRVTP